MIQIWLNSFCNISSKNLLTLFFFSFFFLSFFHFFHFLLPTCQRDDLYLPMATEVSCFHEYLPFPPSPMCHSTDAKSKAAIFPDSFHASVVTKQWQKMSQQDSAWGGLLSYLLRTPDPSLRTPPPLCCGLQGTGQSWCSRGPETNKQKTKTVGYSWKPSNDLWNHADLTPSPKCLHLLGEQCICSIEVLLMGSFS